jgi:hypothetical protein
MDRNAITWKSAWSVGRVLAQRFGGTDHIPPSALTRGIVIHAWCEDYDLGQLVTPDAAYAGWCEAYKAFTYAKSPSWYDHGVERIFDTGQYHGVVDRQGVVHGQETVADIKTGKPSRKDALQLAAYTQALHPQTYAKILRLGIYLSRDGTYRLKVYTNPCDFEEWNTLLNRALTGKD